MTNCINCGAILHGNVCEYCGTEYNNVAISANFQSDGYFGTLRTNNEEIPVYIGNTENRMIEHEHWIDCGGFVHR